MLKRLWKRRSVISPPDKEAAMNTRVLVGSLALALISANAYANVGKIGQILQQQREIREQSEIATGDYVRFGPSALDRMHAAQDRIFRLLEGVSTLEQLDPARQAELFNALEEVKAVLAENEQDKQRCWRERKTGTTLKQTRCATVAELEQIRTDAQEWKGDTSVCVPTPLGISCGRSGE